MAPTLALSTNSKRKTSPCTVHWIADENDARLLVDDLIERSEHSDTWPFMDWMDEAEADPLTLTLGAYNEDLNKWAGFLTYHIESELLPVRPGHAKLAMDVSFDSVYVTESERMSGVGSKLVAVMAEAVCELLSSKRNANSLLKIDTHLKLTGDCLSDGAFKLAHRLVRSISKKETSTKLENQITRVLEDDQD